MTGVLLYELYDRGIAILVVADGNSSMGLDDKGSVILAREGGLDLIAGVSVWINLLACLLIIFLLGVVGICYTRWVCRKDYMGWVAELRRLGIYLLIIGLILIFGWSMLEGMDYLLVSIIQGGM